MAKVTAPNNMDIWNALGKTEDIRERILSSIIVSDAGCWVWQKARRSNGYGRIRLNRKHETSAHRASWMVFNGSNPGDLFVCHKCDNRPCCNPDHLFLGTTTDNMQDMIAKGRQNWTVTNNGSKNGNSKLTEEVVRQILSLSYEEALRRKHEFGITRQNIRHIHQGNTWKHVQHGNLERLRSN